MGVTCNRGKKVLFEKRAKRDKFISFVFFKKKNMQQLDLFYFQNFQIK